MTLGASFLTVELFLDKSKQTASKPVTVIRWSIPVHLLVLTLSGSSCGDHALLIYKHSQFFKCSNSGHVTTTVEITVTCKIHDGDLQWEIRVGDWM